ncbi:UNVERIFIED_CONTAM: hypothetical protein Scaly_1312300 [Sesamum calycinum]|uniref:Uncharacterized protein n=1 Tax=Sesamum calycinum TaxID=2727403 RepID=A0AAW2Q7K7_9LAMI
MIARNSWGYDGMHDPFGVGLLCGRDTMCIDCESVENKLLNFTQLLKPFGTENSSRFLFADYSAKVYLSSIAIE